MTDYPVLIVGAGPTGLVLAIILTRLGVRVRIIDRAASAGTTSRALAVQARTLEFYHQLGLADAVIAAGVKVPRVNFWVNGKRATHASLQHIGEGLTPYSFVLIFPQDAHERLLEAHLDSLGVRVERRTELTGVTQDDDAVRATIRLPDGAEELCNATYLAGCDGASSTVRGSLGVGFPGGTYTGMFYVADVEAMGPAVDGELHLDLSDAEFVILFPLAGTSRVRLVGPVRDMPTSTPEGTTGFTGTTPAVNSATLTFDNVKGKAIRQLQLDIARVNWFSTYRVHHRVAHQFRVRRAFLLGDAAHIHSPVGGQGMNTGIGDAVNLAWKLAAVVAGGAQEQVLDTYESERIAFARRLVETTDTAFTVVTRRGSFARLVRTRVAPVVVPFLLQFAVVRRLLFRTVSQTGIAYHDSVMSAGAAGGIRGGDRLPWVKLADDDDNFGPLSSLRWQVHVYGVARPGVADMCAELGISLHVFEWQPKMRRAGFESGALYLIRPDGYVALADADADPERLRRYVVRLRS